MNQNKMLLTTFSVDPYPQYQTSSKSDSSFGNETCRWGRS